MDWWSVSPFACIVVVGLQVRVRIRWFYPGRVEIEKLNTTACYHDANGQDLNPMVKFLSHVNFGHFTSRLVWPLGSAARNAHLKVAKMRLGTCRARRPLPQGQKCKIKPMIGS